MSGEEGREEGVEEEETRYTLPGITTPPAHGGRGLRCPRALPRGGTYGEDEGEEEAVGRRRGARWDQEWRKAGGKLAEGVEEEGTRYTLPGIPTPPAHGGRGLRCPRALPRGGTYGEDEREEEAVGRGRGGRWDQEWRKAGGRLACLPPRGNSNKKKRGQKALEHSVS